MSRISQLTMLFRETFKEWSEDGAAGIAASLAYYTIFSLSPLLIIIALFLGLLLDQATIQASVIDGVRTTVGDGGAQVIRELINTRRNSGTDVIGTIIWISVVVWGASGLFAQLQNALNKIWEVKHVPGRSLVAVIQDRLFSFVLVMVVGVALLATMFVNTALNRMLETPENQMLQFVVRPIEFIITMVMTTLLIAAVFKVLPDVIIRWRDLWIGALFTAFLFYIGQYLVGLYLSRANVGSVFGTAGSLTAILVWIYYSAQILLFGAEFTEVWARHYGAYIRPDSDATWINEANARREARRANIEFDESDDEEKKIAWIQEQKRQRNEKLKGVVSRVKRMEDSKKRTE